MLIYITRLYLKHALQRRHSSQKQTLEEQFNTNTLVLKSL